MSKKFIQTNPQEKSLLPKKKLVPSSPSLQKLIPPLMPHTRLFTDIKQCYDAANELRNLISSGATTHINTIKSLAKAIKRFKTQAESQIVQTEIQADQEKLNSVIATNNTLSDALIKYKKYKHNERKRRSHSGGIPEELKSNYPIDSEKTHSILKRSRNFLSMDLKRSKYIPSSLLSSRSPVHLPVNNEPKPKPIPSHPSNDSSMSESDRDTPDIYSMSPTSFTKKIEFVRYIQDFEIQGFPENDYLKPVVYTNDKIKILLKKIDKLKSVTDNQDESIHTLRRKLKNKTDKVKELKAEKKELDAYISSLNAKFERLKDDTVNFKAAEEHINALNKLIEDKVTRLDDCKTKIHNMENYIQDMKELFTSKKETLDKNKEQIQEMQEYIVRLNNIVETHEKQAEELKKKLINKEQYIQDIKHEVTAKTELIKDLSVQLQDSQDLVESLRNQIAKLEDNEPDTPEIKDLSRSHLDFSARYRQDDPDSKSLDTTIIIPQTQMNVQIRPNMRENTRSSRFREESKSQAISESALKQTERKESISPVTIIHGDDETVSSQSDYSDRENEMNEEDNEFYPNELKHKPFQTLTIKLQDLVHSKENVSFSNSRNPFYSAQLSSRSLIASMDFSEAPQNYESAHLLRLCVNKRRGILYADSDIEVGITSLTNANAGSAVIYIGNKARFPIQNIETEIYNINKSQVLKASIDIVTDSTILTSITKLERLISFDINSEFSNFPQLLIKYVQSDAVVRHSIVLPITFALCLQSLEISPELALVEYKKLRGYETLKRFQKLQTFTRSLRELAWFLHFSGNSRVFTVREMPEISSHSVMFCCKYQEDSVFYMITLEESSQSLELCIRSKRSKLRECLIPLLSKMISSES